MNRKPASIRWVNMIISLVLIATFLVIANPQPVAVQAATCASYHTVKSGDTLSAIALQYNTTIEAIAEANNIKAPYTILIDQQLCIPAASGTTDTSTTTGTTTTATTSKTTSPYFTATFLDNFVTIALKSYPKKNTYYVNLIGGRSPTLYRLGLINTLSSTSVQQTYRLPKQLVGGNSLTFCIKNVQFDNVQCTIYNRQDGEYFPGFTWTRTYTVEK